MKKVRDAVIMKDYYAILEVHPKASQEIIKKAYLTLAKKYHPDVSCRVENCTEKMQEINEAYSVLSNINKRNDYDKNYFSHNHFNDTIVDDAFEKAINNIYFYCAKYNELLNTKIRKKTEAAGRNQLIAESLLEQFNTEIAVEYKLLSDANLLDEKLKETIAFVMYNFAISFTWGNDFVSAKKCMDIARPWIENTEEHKKFVDNYYIINKEAEKQKVTIEEKPVERVGLLNNFHAISILALIVFCSFYFFLDTSSDKKKTTSQPRNKVTDSITNNNVLIPKKNVLTQYIPDSPLLKNNGLCELTIDNSKNDTPVYGRLWTSDTLVPIRAFTINSHDKFVLKNIEAGKYEIRYKCLYENTEASQGVKSQTFDLEETETENGVDYSIVSITLYKVRYGNFKTTDISVNDV